MTAQYEEFIEFIAKGTTPETMTQFEYSENRKEQIEDLIYRAKIGDLTTEEKKELDQILMLEHIITLAKAKAKFYIKGNG